MKVLLLGSYAPSLLNFRGDLIREMVAAGCNVVAVAPDIDAVTTEKLRGIGAQVHSVPLNRTGFNPFADIAFYKGVSGIMAEVNPDVFIGYTIKPVVWGVVAAARHGVKNRVAMITGLGYAFTEGAGLKRLVLKMIARILYRFALVRATRVIFQNPDDRDVFMQLGLLPEPDKTAIVDGSGVNTDHFDNVSLPAGPSVLMIARLLGDKGVREFGEAAAVIKREFPEVPVRLVGFLDVSPDCISQAELDGIVASGVEFLGRQEDVRDAISKASIYVLPSYREGTPRSVLEAMSMGRAIVTTDAPGCRETVEDGVNGILVEPRNAKILTDVLLELIKDPGRVARMGAQSRRRAVEKYDGVKVSRDVMRLAGLSVVRN